MNFYVILKEVSTKEEIAQRSSYAGLCTPAQGATKMASCLLAEFDSFMSRVESTGQLVAEAKRILKKIGSNPKKNMALAKNAERALMLKDVWHARGYANCARESDDVNISKAKKACAVLEKYDPIRLIRETFDDGNYNHLYEREGYQEDLLEKIKKGEICYKDGRLGKMVDTLNAIFAGKETYSADKYKELAKFLASNDDLRTAIKKYYIVANRNKTLELEENGEVIAPAMKVITGYLEVMRDIRYIKNTGTRRAAEAVQAASAAAEMVQLDKMARGGTIFDSRERAYSDADIVASRRSQPPSNYDVRSIENRGYNKDPNYGKRNK